MAQPISPEAALVRAIYESWRQRRPGELRRHLGASQIGKSCARAIWYGHRWAAKAEHDGRMLRLFDRGDREEAVFVDDLRAIGLCVEPFDPRFPGERRQRRARWHAGHFSHGADALLDLRGCPKILLPAALVESGAERAVGEFKTAKADKWRALTREGLEKNHPQYWAQCQVGMLGHGVEWCLFLSVCKDTDDIYAEWFRLDRGVAERYVERGRQIIEAPVPPPRISDDPSYYECRFCDFREQCHYRQLPLVSCRTCAHSTPSLEGVDGEWTCALAPGSFIPRDIEPTGCASHVFLPPLVPLEVEDADLAGDWVEYRKKDGTTVRNGSDYTRSEDLGDALI